MGKNPETVLTEKIMRYLKNEGAWAVKYPGSAFGTTGTPDILGCLRGRFFAIEVKLPPPSKHPVSKAQAYHIRKIRDAGGIAGVACSVDEAKYVLCEHYEKCQREREVC